jgi:hypothetical protein
MPGDPCPRLIKLSVPPEQATLKHLWENLGIIPKNFKFLFETIEADFGTVREMLTDPHAHLPSLKGRVVCWIVTDGTHEANNSVDKLLTNGQSMSDTTSSIQKHMALSKNEVARKSSKLSTNKIYASINEIVPHRKSSINNTG